MTTAPTCLCNNPPTHTTDEHKAIMAVAHVVDPNCQCGKTPAHTVVQHDAIHNSQPVYPPPSVSTLHSSTNIHFCPQPWGTKVYPDATVQPRVRLWNSGTGRPSSSQPTQQSWLKTQIACLHTHGAYQIDLQFGVRGLTAGVSDSEYQDMCRFVASLGPTQVASVELWNEPDVDGMSMDHVGHYAALARPILHPAGILMVAPSTQSHNLTQYNYFCDHYASLVDCFSHHLYADNPLNAYNEYLAIFQAMVAKGKQYGKPCWMTEWNSKKVSPFSTAGSILGANAQKFIDGVLNSAKAAGMAEIFVWGWDNNDQPLTLLNPTRTGLAPEGVMFVNASKALVA